MKASDLQREVLAHYQAADRTVKAVGTSSECAGGIGLGSTDRELNDYLCIYVVQADVTDFGWERPADGDVDFVAKTFANIW